MKLMQWSPLVALALVCASAVPAAAQDAPEPNWLTVVGLYPGLSTLDAQGELAIVAWLQQARTQTDVARTLAESQPSLSTWSGVLNPALGATPHPMTDALLAQAQADLMPVLGTLQNTFARPRPFVSFPSLTPAIPQDPTFSYPSSQAAVGALYAQIIAQFQSSSRDAILERGNQIGTDRVLVGVQWPSDTAAGKRLGNAFATWWINLPEHRQMIKDACAAEWYKH